MNYTVDKIASIVEGRIFGHHNNSLVIKELLFDSRLIILPENTLFFALKSQRNDGNKYIKELYSKGVRAFVVETLPDLAETVNDAVFILVDNTLQALQKVAASHRNNFNIPIVGITGSNGKTIIKEWLYQIFSPEVSAIRSPKSYNSQIGVPLSVWQLNETHQIGFFEAGISRPNEMQNLEEIIKPTIGIFANIGEAHGKNFDNINNKVEEKLKLFRNVDTLIYCLDHKEIREAVSKLNINTFTWSRNDENADVFISSIDKKEDHTSISAFFKTQKLRNSETQKLSNSATQNKHPFH